MYIYARTCSSTRRWRLVIFHKRLYNFIWLLPVSFYVFYHTAENRILYFYISLCFWTWNFEMCSNLGVDLIYNILFNYGKRFIPTVYYNFIFYTLLYILWLWYLCMSLTDHILCCGHTNNLGYGAKILRTRRWYYVYYEPPVLCNPIIGVD